MEDKTEISENEVSKRIYTLRGCQVMLDSDLAGIYEIEVRILKRAVRENIKRFPSDFMFELTHEEVENLRSKIWISSLKDDSRQHGGNRYMPFVFTELGVAMLSSVLHSHRAIQINIEIMRIFVQLRKQPKTHQLDLIPRIESLENSLRILQRKRDQPDPISMIQNAVARRWGLTTEDLKSPIRKRGISLPRQIAIYLVRNQTGISFNEIGRHFGQRDHSSILYAYRKLEAALDINHMIQETINALQYEIRPMLYPVRTQE